LYIAIAWKIFRHSCFKISKDSILTVLIFSITSLCWAFLNNNSINWKSVLSQDKDSAYQFIDRCNFSTLDNQLNLFIFYSHIAKDQEKSSYQLRLIEGNSRIFVLCIVYSNCLVFRDFRKTIVFIMYSLTSFSFCIFITIFIHNNLIPKFSGYFWIAS
jgi:hypothetical protein